MWEDRSKGARVKRVEEENKNRIERGNDMTEQGQSNLLLLLGGAMGRNQVQTSSPKTCFTKIMIGR